MVLPVDANGYVNAWTDGSCVPGPNGQLVGGIGVWFVTNNPHNASQNVDRKVTNNEAEVMAATLAAKIVVKNSNARNLRIYTDSNHLYGYCKKKFVSHSWEFNELKEVFGKFNHVDVIKVEAHQHQGNVEANKLAKMGAQS